jgi:DNA-binding response OmpR family regulator
MLMRTPGQVVDREHLLEAITTDGIDPNNVDVAIHRLRKLFGKYRAMIRNVWGVGFVLAPPPQEES